MNARIFLSFIFYESSFFPSQKRQEGFPLEPARTVTISTNEGTWMAIDVHPNGEKIVFDLLGDSMNFQLKVELARITEGLALTHNRNTRQTGIQFCFYLIEVAETMFG